MCGLVQIIRSDPDYEIVSVKNRLDASVTRSDTGYRDLNLKLRRRRGTPADSEIGFKSEWEDVEQDGGLLMELQVVHEELHSLCSSDNPSDNSERHARYIQFRNALAI